MVPALKIFGLGTYLPAAVSSTDLITQQGGDPKAWTGWPMISVAGPEDHPSTMAARALREALLDAGIDPSELKLIFCTSTTRDYFQGSFTVAVEVMRLIGAPPTCIGLDINLACTTTPIAMDLAGHWLGSRGDGGYAAIIGSERWSETADRVNASSSASFGDGASAIIVGIGSSAPSIAEFKGCVSYTKSDWSQILLARTGGTRPSPTTPDNGHPLSLYFDPSFDRGIYNMAFVRAFKSLFEQLKKQLALPPDFKPDRVVCSQVHPDMIKFVNAPVVGVQAEQVCLTATKYGHVGASDIVLGLKALRDEGQLAGNIILQTSCPYSWTLGLVTA
jgi:3-oxoacyl-[acyl-carrier-protein] synthase III